MRKCFAFLSAIMCTENPVTHGMDATLPQPATLSFKYKFPKFFNSTQSYVSIKAFSTTIFIFSFSYAPLYCINSLATCRILACGLGIMVSSFLAETRAIFYAMGCCYKCFTTCRIFTHNKTFLRLLNSPIACGRTKSAMSIIKTTLGCVEYFVTRRICTDNLWHRRISL